MGRDQNKSIPRCVNLDWLEVYAMEDNDLYPMNAEYFRRKGYWVTERNYGTRVYAEMFTIQDDHGNAWIEVRRNPMSGSSEFSGLSELSCHLRLVNRACYLNQPIRDLAEFMVCHGYIFQRIFRLDLCYDFLTFDSKDRPDKFLRRYTEKKYSKVNQCKVRVIGDDGWSAFDWESVSWGSPTSMVGTKMYNKTKELLATGNKKPWIVQAWIESKLVSDPLNLPDVWRIEFSIHSSARNWVVIEDNSGKHEKKRAIPHNLELYNGRDRLWQRFQDLAFHYFHFKYVERVEKLNSDGTRDLKRKDLCRDKVLFKWDANHEFYKLDQVAKEGQVKRDDEILRRHLTRYRDSHSDNDVRKACWAILANLDREQLKLYHPGKNDVDIEAIRLKLATSTDWSYQHVVEVAEEIRKLIIQKEIW